MVFMSAIRGSDLYGLQGLNSADKGESTVSYADGYVTRVLVRAWVQIENKRDLSGLRLIAHAKEPAIPAF